MRTLVTSNLEVSPKAVFMTFLSVLYRLLIVFEFWSTFLRLKINTKLLLRLSSDNHLQIATSMIRICSNGLIISLILKAMWKCLKKL